MYGSECLSLPGLRRQSVQVHLCACVDGFVPDYTYLRAFQYSSGLPWECSTYVSALARNIVITAMFAKDTVRDVRGFAVKFYTNEGNWDIVGNNIPVFFIQDAIKFPDIVHAVKPEPHNEVPTGQSAHNNFWDFVGLQPECMRFFRHNTCIP